MYLAYKVNLETCKYFLKANKEIFTHAEGKRTQENRLLHFIILWYTV